MLSACAGPFSALEPDGPSARGAAHLWWIMLAGSAVIFVLVSGVLALAWFRPLALRAIRPGQFLLWGGVVMPGVVLAALVAGALALGERLLATESSGGFRIEAIARQWSWEFRYPDHGKVTHDQLHIPAGQDIHFVVTSEDVIHSFWIPRLGGKIDAIPGQRNILKLRADRPGRFGGVCAEYCGQEHAAMMFTVEAHDAAGFAAQMSALPAGAANGATQIPARQPSQPQQQVDQ